MTRDVTVIFEILGKYNYVGMIIIIAGTLALLGSLAFSNSGRDEASTSNDNHHHKRLGLAYCS